MFPLKDNVESLTLPFITWLIIAVNCLIFFFELSQGSNLDAFLDTYGLIPASFTAHLGLLDVKPIMSSMFLHGGWGHLIGNMWFLYIFGDNVEDRMGHFQYLLFYLLAGAIAAITQVYTGPHSSIPIIGASGAISGVLGAYLIFYPRATVLTMIPLGIIMRLVNVPAVLFLGFWFLMQLFTGVFSLSGAEDSSVAFFAHVGGFVVGVLGGLVFGGRSPEDIYKSADI